MVMNTSYSNHSNGSNRLGFHYFQDTLHYRETDLMNWLPELRSLGASWLALYSNHERAIPEYFIQELLQAGIEPLVQFDLPLESTPAPEQLQTLLETYARWGIQYISLFDRPNDRTRWNAATWAQQDLVDRFLDAYLPLANLTLACGLTPAFPPLEPGGSYWDTAFLRAAYESISRRRMTDLLSKQVLTAYAWTGDHSLNWGAGGPERWPNAKPYFTPSDEQDQRGFRIYDWYGAITQAALETPCPIILLGAGLSGNPEQLPAGAFDPQKHADTTLMIAQLLDGDVIPDPQEPGINLEPLPDQVMSVNFWLLAADQDNPNHTLAWFKPDGSCLPAVDNLHSWRTGKEQPKITAKNSQFSSRDIQEPAVPEEVDSFSMSGTHPIRHYLLLPRFDWGIADWHLDVIQPYIKKHGPTIGFSVREAALAEKVTILGSSQTFSEKVVNHLKQAGCSVERISGDGASIATQLIER
jgi:hypothetical protein